MKKFIIGHSPLTTLAGLLLSILLVIQDATSNGIHDWKQILLPAAIAVFGRLAGDEHAPAVLKRTPVKPKIHVGRRTGKR